MLPPMGPPISLKQQQAKYDGCDSGSRAPLQLEVLHIDEKSSALVVASIPECSPTTLHHHSSGPWTKPPLAKASGTLTTSDGLSKTTPGRSLLFFSEVEPLSVCANGAGIPNQRPVEPEEPRRGKQKSEVKDTVALVSSRVEIPALQELEQGAAFQLKAPVFKDNGLRTIGYTRQSNSETSLFTPRTSPKKDHVVSAVCRPDLFNVERWESFPGTKGQLGWAVQQGSNQRTEIRDPVRANSCPDVAERGSRKNSLLNGVTGRWNEPASSLAAAPKPAKNVWEEELDIDPKIPVERISTSSQAGIRMNEERSGLLARWKECLHTASSLAVHEMCFGVFCWISLGCMLFQGRHHKLLGVGLGCWQTVALNMFWAFEL
ncbi:uncharacterized protein LOC112541373 [Python bivittatus]|uniref:Uncharacterized protein LOC112541373 n=1 Tax=Python bivittatus TaxID=176946 RepID=A0A9F5N308_PYTBI|nr:uncharacterized protein LOC112541373 [Python bivittatus]